MEETQDGNLQPANFTRQSLVATSGGGSLVNQVGLFSRKENISMVKN